MTFGDDDDAGEAVRTELMEDGFDDLSSSLLGGLDEQVLQALLFDKEFLRALVQFQQNMRTERLCGRCGYGNGAFFVAVHSESLSGAEFCF